MSAVDPATRSATIPAQRALAPLTAAGAWVSLLVLEALLLWVAGAYEASAQGAGFGAFLDGLVVFATVAGSVGLFLRIRRPGNSIGALLLAGPILIVAGFLGFATAAARLQRAGAGDLLGGLAGDLAVAALIPGIVVTLAGVAIVFPDGRLPSPRWRIPVRVVAALVFAGSVLSVLGADTSGNLPANPIAIPVLGPGLRTVGSTIGAISLVAAMGLAVAVVAVRFRGARGIERQQLKWFVAAVALNGILLPVSFLTDVGPADFLDVASVLVATLIPVAIGIAILRYRLYEIDTIVNRALVYGPLTAVLAGLMAAAIAVTKQLFESVLGAGTDVTLIVSTVVVVSAFEPIKKRIQAFVDRRLKPADDPTVPLRRLERQFRVFVGALDPERAMREVLTVALGAGDTGRGMIEWRHGSQPTRVLAMDKRKATASAGDAPPSSDAGESADVTVTARAGTGWATIQLSGVPENAASGAALQTLLLAVLEELPVVS